METKNNNNEAGLNKVQEQPTPRIKLTFVGEQYFVNKENGTIACKIETEIAAPNYSLREMICLDKNGYYRDASTIVTVGVATLNEGEAWNEVYGKRIAESKAKKKAYEAAQRFIEKRVVPDLLMNVRSIANFDDQMKYLITNEEKHLERINNELGGMQGAEA